MTVSELTVPELLGDIAAAIAAAKADQEQPLVALDNLAFAATTTNQVIEKLVTDALTDGARWSAIGQALGISKQAAHQRFRHLAPPPADVTANAASSTAGSPVPDTSSPAHAHL